MAFAVFYLGTYVVAAELVSSKKSRGEVLVFRRGQGMTSALDVEKSSVPTSVHPASQTQSISDKPGVSAIKEHTSVFHWRDLCFDIKSKKGTKRILDHVDGWIKPGTITALLVCPLCFTGTQANI